jgi:hypothetical protein
MAASHLRGHDEHWLEVFMARFVAGRPADMLTTPEDLAMFQTDHPIGFIVSAAGDQAVGARYLEVADALKVKGSFGVVSPEALAGADFRLVPAGCPQSGGRR